MGVAYLGNPTGGGLRFPPPPRNDYVTEMGTLLHSGSCNTHRAESQDCVPWWGEWANDVRRGASDVHVVKFSVFAICLVSSPCKNS